MKYKKSVYRSLILITQFGINMIVPIILCTIFGAYIGEKLSIDWLAIPLFFMGALAGFRNIYRMSRRIMNDTEERDERRVKKN